MTVSDLHGGIAHCPSVAHRGVLGLVRAAMGHAVGPELMDDLGASRPEDIVRISTYHYVHVVVASAFDRAPQLARAVPDDLVIYFREMRAANLRRNRAIHDALRALGAALSDAGVEGVALKGGAELLDPIFPEPGLRFLSDIDILVPEAQIDRAVAQLRALGARPGEISELDRVGHHHVEPLLHPDWPVPVEIHRRLGQGELETLIAAEAVFASARPTGVPGLRVPSRVHRLAHAVQHAQLQPPRYRDTVLSLRDAIEMEALEAGLEAGELAEARALFAPGREAAWDGLVAARAQIFGDGGRIAALPPAARRWSEDALAGFGRPGRRRVATLGRWAGWYAREFLTNPQRRRHYLDQLRRPGRLSRFVAAHRDRWFRTR